MRKGTLILVLLLCPTLALSQAETTGRLTGTVLDETQKPLAGAEIVIESPALQGQRKISSDAEGKYLAALLPPGIYMVTVSAPGKAPQQYSVRLGVGQTIPLDPVLRAGQPITEEVVVLAPAVKMETTAGGENFNYEGRIDLLPVINRTIDNVANLAPNISFGPTANTLSISGAPSYDNSVLLDGSDISDPFYSQGAVVYLEEAIEEVQVLTNGVSARYGRFQGGVLNATTKSGGNTYDGTVRIDLSNQSWNAKTPFAENQSDDLNKVYSATVGGPIVKDHLTFFVGGRTIPATAGAHSQLVVPGSFTTETNEDRFQGKLTGSVNANHTIDVSYLSYDRETSNYDPFQWVAEPNAIIPVRTDPREFYTFEYQGVLTERTFLNAQVAKKDVSIRSGGNPALPSPILELFDGEYRAYANGWWDPNDPSVRNNESAALSATHNFSSANWGAHTIEYGIQYVNSITAGDNRQSPTGYNLYLNTPNPGTTDSFASCDAAGNCVFDMDPVAYFNERLKAIPGAGEQELKNTAIYAQDSWEIGKWRLDLGLRFENWKGEAISPAMTLDFDAFSPRIGVTYNINPSWQIQGTWGKYVSRFNDGIANGISGISSIYGPGLLQEYIGPVLLDQTPAQVDALLRDDANWGAILGYVNPLQPTNFFSDDVSAPYANDLNLSLKRALPKNQGVISLTYSKRSFHDLLENYVGGVGIVTITLPDNTTTDVDRLVWDNCGECNRSYEALTFTWDYRPAAAWDVGGNYTYATTEGNYEGEASGQPAIGSIIGNYPNNMDPNAAFPHGYLLGDYRHRFQGWGSYRWDLGRGGKLTLGGILFYRSGSAYSHTGRVAAGNDPEYLGAPSTYTKYFGGRGNQRYNGFWNLDTTLRYDIGFWKQLGAYVKLDVQNIMNNDELVTFRTGGTVAAGAGGVDTFVPNANYGTASSENNYQRPRTFGVTLGLDW